MTINFALSLSYAGIDLLQRVDDGWRRIGTASLLSPDLASDLAKLREQGAARAPLGLRTKIVIPAEQIKYLAIDSTRTSLDDIHALLDGATPYPVDALAIDYERAGGRTHIAAVARETLVEAEEFAVAHGFNPVCFVAVPEPLTFRQEIFFGPTSCARDLLNPDETPQRDTIPVVLAGTRIKSRLHVIAPAGPVADTPVTTPPAPVNTPPRNPLAQPFLDRVIAEYRPGQLQPPVIASPDHITPTKTSVADRVAVLRPAPSRRAFAVPAAVAASVAVIGVMLWGIYGTMPAATPETASPAVATVPAAEPATELAVAPAPVAAPLPVVQGEVMAPDAARAAYDATGVWQRAPRFTDQPQTVTTDGLIRPENATPPVRGQMPALPSLASLETDLAFVTPVDPPAADTAFDLDDAGFVRATPEGTLTPDGTPVFAGLPDLPFRERPQAVVDAAAIAATAQDSDEATLGETGVDETGAVAVIAGRPPVVPPLRPAQAPETAAATDGVAAATAGGVSLAGLQSGAENTAPSTATPPPGAIRPQPRPALPQVDTADAVVAVLGGIALATPDPLATASARAVATSLRPTVRPANFDTVVASARSSQQPAAAPEPAIAAAVAPTPPPAAAAAIVAPPPPPPAQVAAPVAPQNYEPVPGGVARAATQTNAIRLRETNLIGIYGPANARRALVRLSNGQYMRVQVGSELDGGQVTAIGENALNYVVRGTTYALQIPRG